MVRRLWIPVALLAALLVATPLMPQGSALTQRNSGLHGYIIGGGGSPPRGYGHGVSFYSTAWPILKEPLAHFQIGLPGIWVSPDNRTYSQRNQLCPPGTLAYEDEVE